MNKIGRPTYHSKDKESLIFAAADIEGGHRLPLYSDYILEHFKHVIKTVKFWCGDNAIINNSKPQVFTPNC